MLVAYISPVCVIDEALTPRRIAWDAIGTMLTTRCLSGVHVRRLDLDSGSENPKNYYFILAAEQQAVAKWLRVGLCPCYNGDVPPEMVAQQGAMHPPSAVVNPELVQAVDQLMATHLSFPFAVQLMQV